MDNIYISDMEGNKIDAKLIFSFHCDETSKKYIAIDYQKQVFEKNSRYSNLDILEVIKEGKNSIYVTNIKDNEWDTVKKALQYKIFASIKNPNLNTL
ncbi:MAG: DUF1292 domain-containing protein [Clostridia bacterium]|nr:DUF1292 domain-containing protein [Clostridia bacterium]